MIITPPLLVHLVAMELAGEKIVRSGDTQVEYIATTSAFTR